VISKKNDVDGSKVYREHVGPSRQYMRDIILGVNDGLVSVFLLVEALDKDDDAFLKTMMALEFGVVDEERRSPYTAAVLSGLLFLAGSMPSVIPFFFVESTGLGLFIAAVGAGIALFVVGVLKTFVTRKNWLWAGTENVLIATAGAIVSYGVGVLYDTYA
jgi:VIT1/CCC1 family predicted Fe2+/Mn2+ transporter